MPNNGMQPTRKKPRAADAGRWTARHMYLWRLLTLLLLSVLGLPAALAQTEWLLFRAQDPQFRFVYPPDWRLGKPRGPNVRATLFPPQGAPSANCNIIVRREPELAKSGQSQLNQMIQSSQLGKDDWAQMLGGRWPDLTVVQSTHTKVHNQPAYLGVLEFSHETVDRKTFIRGMQLATFTPGYVWHFSCAGRGPTPQDARRSYQSWEPTFRRMLGSLVFENP